MALLKTLDVFGVIFLTLCWIIIFTTSHGTENHEPPQEPPTEMKMVHDLGDSFNNAKAHKEAHLQSPKYHSKGKQRVSINGAVNGNGMTGHTMNGHMVNGNSMNGHSMMHESGSPKMKSTMHHGSMKSPQIQAEEPKHHCDRECEWPPVQRNCEYHFTVEWTMVMSHECGNCPFTKSDCFAHGCVTADGVKRPVITVNKKFPGPSIRVCHKDNIKVVVSNELQDSEGLTIHWHGQYQRGSQFMDGVEMITQCPIPAMTSFTYEFEANPPGTHWWHAHSGLQRADGVFGAFIVKQPAIHNPHRLLYDVDSDDQTLFVTDWTQVTTLTKILGHHRSTGSNKPDSLLINGRACEQVASSGEENFHTPQHIFNVRPNTRYRFRAISSTWLFCPAKLSIDDHQLLILSTDGADVEPVPVTSVVMNSGERFDFVLTTDQPLGRYWVRVQGLGDCEGLSQKSLLRYAGSEEAHPLSQSWEEKVQEIIINPLDGVGDGVNTLSLLSLNTLPSSAYTQAATNNEVEPLFIGFDYGKRMGHGHSHHGGASHRFAAQLNNITFKFPSSPILTQLNDIDENTFCDRFGIRSVDENRHCNNKICICTHMIDVRYGSIVRMVLFDEGGTFESGHPFHLHGQHFAVLAMDKFSPNDPKMPDLYGRGLNFKTGGVLMKDTVLVPDGGYTVIQFTADNPGMWLFHCHLQFHSATGMALLLNVESGVTPPIVPPSDFPKCGSWKSSQRPDTND